MNRARIEQLRDHIEGLEPKQFDMEVIWNASVRKGGVEGHAYELFARKKRPSGIAELGDTDEIGAKLLGLPLATARELFTPSNVLQLEDITINQTVTALNNLLDGCDDADIWAHLEVAA